jgi:hypothetical protein
MEERPAVEEWRSTLTDYERRNLNNPVIVWRKWTAATKVKKLKPRTAGVSASEAGRAQAMVQQQDERIHELEEELAAAHERQASPPYAALQQVVRFVKNLSLDPRKGLERDIAAIEAWLATVSPSPEEDK